MGLTDVAEGIGGAISDGASTIAAAGSSAIGFAKGIADKAESFVEDKAGPIGAKVFQTVSGMAEGPIGLASKIGSAIGEAVADPTGFVENLVESSKAKASSAMAFAEAFVDKMVHTGLSGVKGVFGLALTGAKTIARSLAAGVGLAAKGIAAGFAGSLKLLKSGALFALKGGAGLTKGALTLITRAGIATTKLLQQSLMKLTARATTTLLTLTGKAFNFARQKVATVAAGAQRKADAVVQKALPRVLGVTAKVAETTKAIAQSVQSTLAGVMKRTSRFSQVIPGFNALFGRAFTGINNLVGGGAAKAAKLNNLLSTKVAPLIRAAHATMTANLGPMLQQVFQHSSILERNIASQIAQLGQSGLTLLSSIGTTLEVRLRALEKGVNSGIDAGVSFAASAANTLVDRASGAAIGIAKGVGEFAVAGEQAGEEFLGEHFGGVAKALAPEAAGMGRALRRVGQVVAKVGSAASNFAGGVIAGGLAKVGDMLTIATRPFRKKHPHDGELTGPFYPQSKEAPTGNIEALHGEFDEGTRRSALKKGAHIFVNGIDTTLEAHYSAAQRLANELGKPVVGIYNATGGQGRDLLQCAADKLFDRGENPAISTLVGILKEQGHKQGKAGPSQIYAHSQGSLVVSEALRQAGKGGANLQQYEVTTFGNAAYTFPKGPRYHHYVHDDDLVPAMAGTSSRISAFMNQTRIGRWLSEKALGQLSDPQKDTVVLHHGGSMIDPHSLNATKADGTADKAERKRDYIGHLKMFRAEEEKRSAKRGPKQAQIQTTVGFAMARGIGQMASDAVHSGYTKMDRVMRLTAPMLPSGVASSLWTGLSQRLSSLGHSIYAAGTGIAAAHDSAAFGRTYSQGAAGRTGGSAGYVQKNPTSDSGTEDPTAIKAQLDQSGEAGFAPDLGIRDTVAPHLGFDPELARFHTGPAAASAAQALGAEAFTIGRDVYFGAGQYNPSSPEGMSLIAHELTHVGQQHSGLSSAIQESGPTGSSHDRMETEARTIAMGVLRELGSPEGFQVKRLQKIYQADEGIGRNDELRLDRIGALAIKKVEERAPKKTGTIESVNVTIDLDLTEMSDDEAATIWAEAILAQIQGTPVLRQTSVPSPRLLQKNPVAATPDAAGPQKPVILPMHEMLMKQQLALIVEWQKKEMSGIFYAPFERKILDMIQYWKDMDDAWEKSTGYKGTTYLDKFLRTLFIKTYVIEGIITDRWTNAFDEIHFQATEYGKGRLKTLTAPSKEWRGGPINEEPESVWSYIGKRELYAGMTAVKHLSTGLASVFDAGVWVGEKIGGQKLNFSLANYVGKSWDENIINPASKGLGIDPNEKLIGDFTLKNVSDIGGKTLSGLTMAGALAPAAGASTVVKVGAAGIGVAQAGMAGEALYDKVTELRKAGKTWKEIASQPDIWVDVVSVVAGAVGAAGGFAKEGSQLAKTLTSLGQAANGAQLATLGAAIYVTNNDAKLSDAEKANRNSDFISTFLVTGASMVNTKYGQRFEEAWKRKAQEEMGQLPPAEQKALPPGQESSEAPPPAPPEPPAPKVVEASPAAADPNAPAGAKPVLVPEALLLPPAAPAAKPRADAAEGKNPAETIKNEPPEAAPKNVEEAKAQPASGRNEIQSENSWEALKAKTAGDPVAQKRLHEARMAIHQEAKAALAEKFPDMGWEQLGASTKMSNDADVTMKPKLPPNPTAEDIANAIQRSGEAAEFVRAKLREAVNGDPAAAIDTNIYTYTGSEAPVPVPHEQASAVAKQLDSAALAAMKESMTPAEWNDFKTKALEKAHPSGTKENEVGRTQYEIGKQIRSDLEARMQQAEKTTTDIHDAKVKAREDLLQKNPALKDQPALLDGLVRDTAADQFRGELVAALKAGDIAKARELQTKIKMVEEGAYVTAAAYDSVVQAQQRMSRGESKFEKLSDDPHQNAQAAADIYAQMKKHAESGSLMDRLKSVAKNRARLEIEAGRPGDVPFIEENFSQNRMKDNYNQLYAEPGGAVPVNDQAALQKMVTDWAGVNPDAFTPQLAEQFINAQLDSGLNVVIGLQNSSAAQRVISPPKGTVPPKQNPPQQAPSKAKSESKQTPPKSDGNDNPPPPPADGGGGGGNNPPPGKKVHRARSNIPPHDMGEFTDVNRAIALIEKTGGKNSPLLEALKNNDVNNVRGSIAEEVSAAVLNKVYDKQVPLDQLAAAQPAASGKPPAAVLRNVSVQRNGIEIAEIDAVVVQKKKDGLSIGLVEQVKSSGRGDSGGSAGEAIGQLGTAMELLNAAKSDPSLRLVVDGQDVTSTLTSASTDKAIQVARLPSDVAQGQFSNQTGLGGKDSGTARPRIENLGANEKDIQNAAAQMLANRERIIEAFNK